MAYGKLPWEMEEDILSRLQPCTLTRFRTVCKRWNAIFREKSFINNHLARALPQFIALNNSKIYSIDIIGLDSIDPTIKLRDIPLSATPYHDLDLHCTTITTCAGFWFLNSRWMDNGLSLWNPWLRQVQLITRPKWTEYKDKVFSVCGVGYDNSGPEKVYKIFGFFTWDLTIQKKCHQGAVIYEYASHALKFIDTPDEALPIKGELFHVSLNGNLYWINLTSEIYGEFIQSVDFSRDVLKPFSLLPCQKELQDKLVLTIYKGDRFALLKQCDVAKHIEIWVTKKRVDNYNSFGDVDVWINLMTLPTTNFPTLFNKVDGVSYFIYDKTLIMYCAEDICGDSNELTCIYIVRRDMFKKFQIDSLRCCHCVYAPNLVSVPLELDLRLSELQV